jgi:hypothetical protein
LDGQVGSSLWEVERLRRAGARFRNDIVAGFVANRSCWMTCWQPHRAVQAAKQLTPLRRDRVLEATAGHATIAITLDVYSHVIPGMDAQAANAVASLILDDPTEGKGPGPKSGPSTDK